MRTQLLDVAHPDERDLVWFSYDRLLDREDQVQSATVTVTDSSGADATPSVRMDGAPAVQQRRVGQWMNGLVAGANYLLRCTATAASGRRLDIYAVLPVRRP